MRTKLFVEAIPLVEDKTSGVAHSLAGLVGAIAADKEFMKRYEVVLLAPRRNMAKLDRWPALQQCSRKGIWIRMRILRGLMKFHLLPPMDLFFGRGVYLFGNFRHWRVTGRSKSLTYLHDICYAIYPEFVAPKNQQMLIKKMPGFIGQTDKVITVSESSRREIIGYYKLPPEKVIVLYNAPDTAVFRPHSSTEIASVKKRYGITQKYLLFIGNIEPRKNLKRLVEAFSQLPQEYSLVLVGGSGWLNEEVYAAIEAAQKQGASIIKPDVFVPDADAGALASGAEALVLPSIHEGFGMPAVEGMISQVPVLVADIPALREVVGEAGLYFDPLDVTDISGVLKRAVSLSASQRTNLIKKGIIWGKQFSWEKTAKKLLDVLDRDLVQR